ncbi:MAG: YggS family pyridoxal phosphate-dependent enzyme [Gammaproteobacteria bacterium]|nr:YggS family pyridoxal phosphate-dependent enzyme [Gammaproteobacteria bacterium]
MPDKVEASLRIVRERIGRASGEAARDPGDVRIIAVCKQQSVMAITSALDAGQRELGESFLNEALEKMAVLARRDIIWHFVGALQSNKTRGVAEHFQWVHALDRVKIARRLASQRPHHAGPLDVCIQVSLVAEPGKAGVAPDGVAALAAEVAGLDRLRLRGLMCIPPQENDPERQRAHFRRLREIKNSLVLAGHTLDTLSMGMSADFEAAVREGATLVRIGTAIFGPR